MIKSFSTVKSIEIYTPDRELEGHIFGFGRIGGGKSVSIKSIIEGYHDIKGYKIFDLWGGERNEHLFWAIPSQDKAYWEKFSALGSFDEDGPKQYKVNFLYPLFMSKLPKDLPKKEPWVNSRVFTIPIQDITYDDIKMVMGNLSGTSISGWEDILHNLKKNDTCGSLDYLSKKCKVQSSTNALYKSFIVPMEREGFLQDAYNEQNIDLIKESRNKEVITVLCLEYVPKLFQLFVLNYFIRKLTELVDKGKIHNKNLLFIREASYFFKATEDSIMEERYKIFRSKCVDYLRMGRRGTYFALDCQSPFEVRGMVQGSEDYMLMFKTTSWRDKEEMCGELKRERRMRQDQIGNLAFLEPGECYIAETGAKVVKKVKLVLCRTMYWRKDIGNFYNIWEDYGGSWLNANEVKDKIEEKVKERRDYYKRQEKVEKKTKGTAIPIPVAQQINQTEDTTTPLPPTGKEITKNLDDFESALEEEYKLEPLPY